MDMAVWPLTSTSPVFMKRASHDEKPLGLPGCLHRTAPVSLSTATTSCGSCTRMKLVDPSTTGTTWTAGAEAGGYVHIEAPFEVESRDTVPVSPWSSTTYTPPWLSNRKPSR